MKTRIIDKRKVDPEAPTLMRHIGTGNIYLFNVEDKMVLVHSTGSKVPTGLAYDKVCEVSLSGYEVFNGEVILSND